MGAESDEYVVADASHLPFKDGIFDKVVGNAILHHVLKKLDTVAEEIFRVTRSGGPNVFAGEIVASRPIGWLWKRTVLRKNPSEGLATKEHWTRAFERAGFTDVEVSMEDRYGYAKVLGRNVYYGLVRHFPKEFVTGWLITSATIAFQKASEN